MTPHKLRNIIFIAICICALSIAFIYQGAKWAHVLPASFNNGTFSYLENANLQGRPSPSYANIKNGTFQKQVEKWITGNNDGSHGKFRNCSWRHNDEMMTC